jgi:hypothetical protein
MKGDPHDTLPWFREVPIGWKTPEAVAVARAIYETRDPSLYPILADAIDDAGDPAAVFQLLWYAKPAADVSVPAVLRGPGLGDPPVATKKVPTSHGIYDTWTPNSARIWAERLVAQLASDETCAAVAWLDQFSGRLGYDDEVDDETGKPFEERYGPTYTYAQVIAIGHRLAAGDEVCFWTDSGADYFRDARLVATFFAQWSLVTGIPTTPDQRENINFRCAC